MPSKKSEIKVGSVRLPLWEHKKGWRTAYRDKGGTWKYITRKDKAELMEEGRRKAREIHNGSIDLAALPASQTAILRRVLDLGITHADLDDWEGQRKRKKVLLAEALKSFLEEKRINSGLSNRNLQNLTIFLTPLSAMFGDRDMASLSVADLDRWMASRQLAPRSRKNWRGAAITFFRWARDRGYLPDVKTEAEKLAMPIVRRKIPETWSAEEMRTLLDECRKIAPEYLPWLVLAGFSGLRQEELILPDGSRKSPLDWSDIHWDRGIIIVRPETGKVDRRIIPILPVTKAWLYSRRKSSGPVCPQYAPHRSWKRTEKPLTTRLGKTVGGWRRNALRHSFISYRAAIVGLAQTAMEAGNSESESRKSYNDAKSKEDAEQWFSLLPSELIGTKNKSR